jgi:hypothetical protein
MTDPSPNITVEVHPSTRPGTSQLASASVRLQTDLGPITINDCRILRNKSGVSWFALPSYSVQQSTTARQYQYLPTTELPAELLEQVSLEALRAYRAWSDSQNKKSEPQGVSTSHGQAFN